MKRIGWVGLLVVCGALPQSALAFLNVPGQFAQESPAIGRSVRALGMGNAFIAVDGGPHSPFYNPAGLNDVTEGSFAMLSPSLEVSSGSLGLIGDIKDLVDDLDNAPTDADQVGVLDQFVASRFGEFNNARLQLQIVNYTRHNFAAGAFLEERINLAFRDQSLPRFDALNITDLVFYVGLAHNWYDKLLQVGGTFKPIIRSSLNERINATTAMNDEVDDVFHTLIFPHLGFGLDLGLKSDLSFPGLMRKEGFKRLHGYLKPAVGLTWQDIGNTVFNTELRSTDGNESGVEDPTKFANAVSDSPVDNESSVSLGAKVSPTFGVVETNIALDFRDLNQDSEFISKTHFGVEAIITKMLALRAGLKQGYLAAGFGLNLWIVGIDFATYAEEVGIFGSQDGNRRYAVTLNFGI
jgi:hypothetical protein